MKSNINEADSNIKDNLNEKYDEFLVGDTNYNLYIDEASNYPLLTEDEEKNLLIRYKLYKDSEAKEKLINSNLRLVISIAKKYLRKNEALISINDLIQEGNLGLMKAIEKYDLSKGTKLSTYATCWIKNYVRLYVKHHSKGINISNNMLILIDRFLEYQEAYKKRAFIDPSDEEYLKYLGISKEKLSIIRQTLLEIRSLDEIGEKLGYYDDEAEQIQNTENFENDLIKKIDGEQFWNEVARILDPKEYDILLRRFGKKIGNFGCEYIQTLKEIRKKYDMTPSMINYVEKKAIKKLTKSERINLYNK